MGKYKDYEYRIERGFACQLAYVKLPKSHPLYKVDYRNDEIEKLDYTPHGYFTYSGNRFDNKNEWWLGWDYGHAGDYWGIEGVFTQNGKKWSREEIEAECKAVIDALIAYKEQR